MEDSEEVRELQTSCRWGRVNEVAGRWGWATDATGDVELRRLRSCCEVAVRSPVQSQLKEGGPMRMHPEEQRRPVSRRAVVGVG